MKRTVSFCEIPTKKTNSKRRRSHQPNLETSITSVTSEIIETKKRKSIGKKMKKLWSKSKINPKRMFKPILAKNEKMVKDLVIWEETYVAENSKFRTQNSR